MSLCRHGLLCGASLSALAALLAASPALATVVTTGNAPPINTPGDFAINNFVTVGGNGTGSLTINGGSTLEISGTDGGGIPFGLTIGSSNNPAAPADGTVTVTGAGSTLDLPTGGGFINVGRRGGTSSGALIVQAGGAVNASFLNAGRGDGPGTGATGTIIIDGGALNLSGTAAAGGAGAGQGSPAGGTIGRDSGGSATLTVRNGGSITVDATGAAQGGGGFTLGRDAGTSGTFNVESGATVNITGSAASGGGGFTVGQAGSGALNISGGAQVTLNGTFNAGFTLGREAGSSGSMSLTGGADLTINNSNPNFSSGFSLGGNAGSVGGAGGAFNMLVSGAGTTLTVNGADPGFTVGRNSGSSGTMTVSNGAVVNAQAFAVARNAGSSGTLNVSGAGTQINLNGDTSSVLGAGFSVGAAGLGTMNVTAGAVINIDQGTAALSGMNVGGSTTVGQGGTGTLNVSGPGTQINVTGSNTRLQVGYENLALSGGGSPSIGTMSITNGAVVDLGATARATVGATTGSVGTLNLSGAGSMLKAGEFLGVGQDADDDIGGIGTMNVGAGTEVHAATIHVGQSGTVTGTGTLVGDVFNDGVINPGNSPGTLRITGGVLTQGDHGVILLEIQEVAPGVFEHDRLVFDDGVTPELEAIQFVFLDDTDVQDVVDAGLLDIDNFFLAEDDETGLVIGLGDALENELDPNLLDAYLDELMDAAFTGEAAAGGQTLEIALSLDNGDVVVGAADVASVPEPAALGLLGLGLAGLAYGRRRRAAA